MPSPIERMIDAACGVKPGDTPAPPSRIQLECKKCGKTKMVQRVKHDPPAAVKVCITCPECNPGDFDETMHFDAEGRHLHPGTGLPF